MVYENENISLIASLLSVKGFNFKEIEKNNDKLVYKIQYSNQKKLDSLLQQYKIGKLTVDFEKYKNNLNILKELSL